MDNVDELRVENLRLQIELFTQKELMKHLDVHIVQLDKRVKELERELEKAYNGTF